MKKLLFLVMSMLLYCFSAPVFASGSYTFVITGNGLEYYQQVPTQLPDVTITPSSCQKIQRKYRDPSGGRGIFVEECLTPTIPIAIYKTRTYDYSPEKWSQCQFLKRQNAYVYLKCPRIYTK